MAHTLANSVINEFTQAGDRDADGVISFDEFVAVLRGAENALNAGPVPQEELDNLFETEQSQNDFAIDQDAEFFTYLTPEEAEVYRHILKGLNVTPDGFVFSESIQHVIDRLNSRTVPGAEIFEEYEFYAALLQASGDNTLGCISLSVFMSIATGHTSFIENYRLKHFINDLRATSMTKDQFPNFETFSLMLDDEKREKYRKAFDVLDGDRDGLISAEEVEKAMSMLGRPPTGAIC